MRGTFQFLKTIIVCKHARQLTAAAEIDTATTGILPMSQDVRQWASAVLTVARRKHYEREVSESA